MRINMCEVYTRQCSRQLIDVSPLIRALEDREALPF